MKSFDKISLCQDSVELGREKSYWLHSLSRHTLQIRTA